jgi:hypothetical protein
MDLGMIEREIRELEGSETCYKACERLAWLYICRDHLKHVPISERVPEPAPVEGSEFVMAASVADPEGLMRVLDEHMEALKVVQEKEYESVMRKIRELGDDSGRR